MKMRKIHSVYTQQYSELSFAFTKSNPVLQIPTSKTDSSTKQLMKKPAHSHKVHQHTFLIANHHQVLERLIRASKKVAIGL